jgi:hypothetical protein
MRDRMVMSLRYLTLRRKIYVEIEKVYLVLPFAEAAAVFAFFDFASQYQGKECKKYT